MRHKVIDAVAPARFFLSFRFGHLARPKLDVLSNLFQAGAGQRHLLDLVALACRYCDLCFQPDIKVLLRNLFRKIAIS